MSLSIDILLTEGGFHLEVDAVLDNRVTGIMGPSGAGKTTLLEALAGLRRPDAGRLMLGNRILFDSEKGIDLPAEDRRLGIVFQEPRLFPHLTVRRNLLYGDRGGIPLQHVAQTLDIAPLLDRYPAHLSGGEQQRVALGRALLSAPEILLLDEPVAALDQGLKNRVLPFLSGIQAEWGIPALFVSHALPEILELTDQILVLDRGCLLAHGEVYSCLGSRGVLEMAHVLGIENLLTVQVESSDASAGVLRARLGAQQVVLPFREVIPGTTCRIGIRPEDVILSRRPVEGLSARNSLHGTVVDIQDAGGPLLVHVDIGNPMRVEVTREAVEDLGLDAGVKVWCHMKTSAFRWRTTPRVAPQGSD